MWKERGVTLPEMLVTMAVILIVVAASYYVLIFFQRSFLGQNIRMEVYSQMRGLISEFEDRLSQAGVGLNLIHTDAYVGAEPAITGIIPLNSDQVNPAGPDNDPDGVIIAIGDIKSLTKPTAPWHPSQGQIELQNIFDSYSGDVLWHAGDVGIIVDQEAFYVFRVEAVDQAGSALQLRSEPVYYSGLLNINESSAPYPIRYRDLLSDAQLLGETGNNHTYQTNSVVLRLNFFGIYHIHYDSAAIFDTEPAYYLVLTTDTRGEADPCNIAQPEPDRCVPLAKNVVDLQLEYISGVANQPEQQIYWCSSGADTADIQYESNPNYSDLYEQVFRNRNLLAIRVTLMLVTESFREKPAEQFKLLPAADRTDEIAIEEFNKKMLRRISVSIFPRNYNTVY